VIEHLTQAHASAKAQYDKVADRFANLDAVRQQLQSLRDLGDFVEQDDVVRSASHLVGKGLTPAGLAGLLAGMPKDGQALAGWVEQMWKAMLQREQQLQPVLQKARFAMGVTALQSLAGQHVQQRVGELQQAQANAMGPQAGPDDSSQAAPAEEGAPDAQQ
jgi:hypothetical protein